MNSDEFTETWGFILSVCQTAQLIPAAKVEELLAVAVRSHTLGPLLEPTMYQQGGYRNLREQETIGRAFLALLKAIDKVKTERGT